MSRRRASEVELGMLPLDVDLPGPPPGMLDAGTAAVRLTLRTSRGGLTIRQPIMLQQPGAPLAGPPTLAGPDVEHAQYDALLRSVERSYELRRPLDPGDINGVVRTLWDASRFGPGDVINGVAGSPGTAQGSARVVRTLVEASKLQQSDILVCEMTVPTCVPLFATVAAVVADSGGILSKTAESARDCGIPAVLGTVVGTNVIRDGMTLTVDGTQGLVRIESSA